MEYVINSEKGTVSDGYITFTAESDAKQAFFSMDISFPAWEEDCYIMIPACAYNGNRQKRVARDYPPMYHPDETGIHCEPLMTDVPALNPDGSGQIQVTTGDMATPCVGIFNRKSKESFFVFTEQEIKGKNLGFTVEAGKISVSYPANRTDLYRFCRPHEKSGDKGIPMKSGEKAESHFKIFTYFCSGITEFYEQFFNIRKSLLRNDRAPFLYTKELWELMEHHFNTANWSGEYYAEASKIWQCGWVGGGMSTYPLLKYGSGLSKERAVKTIDYLTSHQAESGFYLGYIKDGIIMDDSFKTPGMENIHMTRKSADGLYYLFKNFTAADAKPEWIKSAKRCADAFVKLFEKYGTFGQFVDVNTGEMIVGCSTSATMAPGALAKAGEYFGNNEYLKIAEESLQYYCNVFEKTGVTNGGPGEILSAPDSESAFALLESCIALYETTKAEKWLDYAKTAAHYCSSWVVSYSYKFPEGSEFNRLGINTVGSIFANVQNKHSAPGICTFSGDCLLKLYRYTGNSEYLELIKDIAYFIPQCVSTEEKTIYSWNNPPQKLIPGYICERVNMSDWEDFPFVGGVFNGTCWPETSLTLSFAELMTEDEMIERK